MSDEQRDEPSLYTRLGGYDAIYVFAAEALRKAMAHPATGHIWAHMSESTFYREDINFVDFLCSTGAGTSATGGGTWSPRTAVWG